MSLKSVIFFKRLRLYCKRTTVFHCNIKSAPIQTAWHVLILVDYRSSQIIKWIRRERRSKALGLTPIIAQFNYHTSTKNKMYGYVIFLVLYVYTCTALHNVMWSCTTWCGAGVQAGHEIHIHADIYPLALLHFARSFSFTSPQSFQQVHCTHEHYKKHPSSKPLVDLLWRNERQDIWEKPPYTQWRLVNK